MAPDVGQREVALIADLGELADRPHANPALRRRSGRIGFQAIRGPSGSEHRDQGTRRKEGNSPGEAVGARDPDGAQAIAAYRALGKSLAAGRDWDRATIAFREAIRLKPDDPATHLELARVLGQKGLREEATAEFREAIRLRPDDPAIHSAFAELPPGYGDVGARGRGRGSREAARLRPKGPPGHAPSWSGSWPSRPCPGLRNPPRPWSMPAKRSRSRREGSHLPDDAGPGHVPLTSLRGGAGRAREVPGVGRQEGTSLFLVALVHGQKGEKEQARPWFDKAVDWMKAKSSQHGHLRLLWTEAAALLGQPGPNGHEGDGRGRPLRRSLSRGEGGASRRSRRPIPDSGRYAGAGPGMDAWRGIPRLTEGRGRISPGPRKNPQIPCAIFGWDLALGVVTEV